MSKYLEEALWVASLVVDKLADEDRLLPTRIDAQSGEVLDAHKMIGDLGDYVQNIWYLGKMADNQRLQEFALSSVYNAALLYQDESGLFEGAFRYDPWISWWSNEDVFVGLTTLYRLSRDSSLEDIILRFQQGIAKHTQQSGLLCCATRGFRRYVTTPPRTFVEGAADVYVTNSSKESLKLAGRLVEPWIHSKFFKRYGLFPSNMMTIDCLNNLNDRIYRYKLRNFRRFGNCDIPKTNTNFLHGILELQKVTKEKMYSDAMRHWIDSIEVNLVENGFYASSFNVYTKNRSHSRKPIGSTIVVLAFYADFCKSFGDQRIREILELRTENILQSQSKIGFFRDAPHDPKDPKYNRGFLDCQTDMSVLLLKLYSLTANDIYLEASKRCIDSVIKYLKRPYGYVEYFNVVNGNADYHSRMYTKFLTLFIKALILLDSVLSGKNVYQDDLFVISRDR